MISLEQIRWQGGDFSLEVDLVLHQQVTGLYGASGAGKSTLLEIVAGLRRPRTGRVRMGDLCFSDTEKGLFQPPEARHVGYVPQDGALFPHLDVEANLHYGAPRRTTSATALDERFSTDAVCALLGIGHLRSASVDTLSGGERQRVALARALLSQPRILLLDEPLANLDAARKELILPYLVKVQQTFSLPVLYVSHSPAELVALCGEVIWLEAGQLKARGAPLELFVAGSQQVWEPRYRAAGDGAE